MSVASASEPEALILSDLHAHSLRRSTEAHRASNNEHLDNAHPLAQQEPPVTRDWDIIRAVLLKIEAAATPNVALKPTDFPDYSEQWVAYNMRLLNDAGYIVANILDSHSGDGRISAAIARRLTHKGHELLDTIRSESVWSKVRETFKTKGVDMTFDLVFAVGKKITEGLLLG